MSDNIKISIVTISYNYGSHLEETIKSIVGCGYANLEYIVIDGGSTDGSVEIIKKYEDRISYWASEKDNGISDALNKGISKCTGELVGLIHAGDKLAEGALQIIASEYEKNKFDFCFGNLDFCDDNGNIIFNQNGDKDYIKKIEYTMPAILHPTVFVRKDVYDRYGSFSSDYKLAMDYEFFLRVTKEGVVGQYIDETIAVMHHGGASVRGFYASYKEVAKASVKYGYNQALASMRLYGKGIRGYTAYYLNKSGFGFLVKVVTKITTSTIYNKKDES